MHENNKLSKELDEQEQALSVRNSAAAIQPQPLCNSFKDCFPSTFWAIAIMGETFIRE